jgi:hypothetical protein
MLLVATVLPAIGGEGGADVAAPAKAQTTKTELRILTVGNYLIMQGYHARQIAMVGEALGVAPKVRVASVESLYYHAPMVGAVAKQKGLEEESWLPLIRGQWDGASKIGLTSKLPEEKQAFIHKSPDMVLLMADLNGKVRHGVAGKGDEYYDHLAEVMKFYAKTCQENGARLVLWVHPGMQQAPDCRDPKTKELRPMTAEEFAADLGAIQKGLDKISAAVPGIEYLPIPWIFSRLRQEHPEVNLRLPFDDQNGHLMWREYLLGVYALAAHLGTLRPEPGSRPTVKELNEAIGIPAMGAFPDYPNKAACLLTEPEQQAIVAAVWAETKARQGAPGTGVPAADGSAERANDGTRRSHEEGTVKSL